MAMMKKQWPAADYSIWHLLQKQTTYSPSSLHRLPKCTATLTVALWVLGRGWWQWRWSKVIDLRFGRITPLQYSCLENPTDGGAWEAAVHGVATSRIRLSDFTFTFHFPLSCIGEGNGNPLQYSCLENSRDGGAWWAAVYGVAQSDTTEAI